MNKQELFEYLKTVNGNLSYESVALNLACAVLLAVVMYFVYKKTCTGVLYSKSFNVTLILVAVIIAMIMMIIGSNLSLSLGMVGALSVIRFRTAIKEPKDLAFLFWSIVIGLSCGTGMYVIGIIGSAVICILLLIFQKELHVDNLFLLALHLSQAADIEAIEQLLERHTARSRLKMQNQSAGADKVLTYEVRFHKSVDRTLMEELEAQAGVTGINLVSYSNDTK